MPKVDFRHSRFLLRAGRNGCPGLAGNTHMIQVHAGRAALAELAATVAELLAAPGDDFRFSVGGELRPWFSYADGVLTRAAEETP